MNFTDKTKAWILLITLVLSTGAVITVTSYEGGAKLWVAILLGLATGATNVYHALSAGPNKTNDQNKTSP
jgi:hypothetical protein